MLVKVSNGEEKSTLGLTTKVGCSTGITISSVHDGNHSQNFRAPFMSAIILRVKCVCVTNGSVGFRGRG